MDGFIKSCANFFICQLFDLKDFYGMLPVPWWLACLFVRHKRQSRHYWQKISMKKADRSLPGEVGLQSISVCCFLRFPPSR